MKDVGLTWNKNLETILYNNKQAKMKMKSHFNLKKGDHYYLLGL